MTERGSLQRYLVHEWADGMAVFDLATGDTHVLDTATAGYFRAHLEGAPGADAMPDAARTRLTQLDLLG